jgi:uncharacterized protein (TIGR03435 family)
MKRTFAATILLVLHSALAFGHAANLTPKFEIVDVHGSAHTASPSSPSGVFRSGRYVLRQATMLDLIAVAYGVENDKVLGGPSWLENDRFDVIAKAPPATSPETIKLMLQAMLADRFKLLVHKDTKPVPAFVLTMGKGKPKLKKPDGAGTPGCEFHREGLNSGGATHELISCRDATIEEFTQLLRTWAREYLTAPLVDSTGLKDSWDFDFRWDTRNTLMQSGASGTSIFDAVDKQLGLTLSLQNVPMPVIIVDSVTEKPTVNPPEIATSLTPPAPTAFEVAVIKPAAPGVMDGGMITNRDIDLRSTTLKFLIFSAWNIHSGNNEGLVGAPKWLSSDRFSVVAKAYSDAPSSNAPQIDIDDFRQMLRALLIDRFKMAVHTEERPVTAYTLVTANSKVKKADALNRTGCKEGPGPGAQDPRFANPALNRLITCRNITMAQFAEQVQTLAPDYIYYPVLDATGVEGAWDFTLSFSGANQLQTGGASGGDAGAGGVPAASDPNGAVSLFDAINKQLGLKLEMHKRPMPVLVIDHIEEKPTEN